MFAQESFQFKCKKCEARLKGRPILEPQQLRVFSVSIAAVGTIAAEGFSVAEGRSVGTTALFSFQGTRQAAANDGELGVCIPMSIQFSYISIHASYDSQ